MPQCRYRKASKSNLCSVGLVLCTLADSHIHKVYTKHIIWFSSTKIPSTKVSIVDGLSWSSDSHNNDRRITSVMMQSDSSFHLPQLQWNTYDYLLLLDTATFLRSHFDREYTDRCDVLCTVLCTLLTSDICDDNGADFKYNWSHSNGTFAAIAIGTATDTTILSISQWWPIVFSTSSMVASFTRSCISFDICNKKAADFNIQIQ